MAADYTAVVSESGSRSVVTGIVGAVVLATLTWVGANIFIPLVPVPVTLQTLFVLLAGSVVGARYGVFSQFLYEPYLVPPLEKAINEKTEGYAVPHIISPGP